MEADEIRTDCQRCKRKQGNLYMDRRYVDVCAMSPLRLRREARRMTMGGPKCPVCGCTEPIPEVEALTRKNVGLIAIISKLEANIKYRRDENRKLRRNESQLRKVLAAKYVALAAYEEQATTLTRETERLTVAMENAVAYLESEGHPISHDTACAVARNLRAALKGVKSDEQG